MNNDNQLNNRPTYTKELLYMQQLLILHVIILINKPLPFYRQYIEVVRLYLLDLINNKCPPFGVRLSEEEIIENLKMLNAENGVTIIPPDNHSNYLFSCENTNENVSLRYKAHHTHGINHWFFQIWETETWQGKSPLTQFETCATFYSNMDAIIRNGKFKLVERNPNATVNDCVELLKITNGSKPAGNFPSAVAKWIYLNCAERLVKGSEDFYIYDPCMGFGGRLGGALAACNHTPLNDRTVHYHGTDVNNSIHQQYKKVESFWREHINPSIKLTMYNSTVPAESIFGDRFFANMKGKFHVAMTSCPYFNCERYSKDPNQSYIKYPSYDMGGDNSWRLGFLKRMIGNVYELLRDGGEFWLNIADINSNENILGYPYINLENDAKQFAVEAGFTHVLTYNMIIPNINAHRNKQDEEDSHGKISRDNIIERQGKKMKYEPIFVFKKIRKK